MLNVSFQRALDRYIGGPLCIGYSFFHGAMPPKDSIKEILVVRLWTLGETILTLPMIKKLRQEFPRAKITVLARNRNKNIFKYVDFVDQVLLFEKENFSTLLKMRGHYDLAIDTEPYLRVSGLLSRFLAKGQIGFDHGARGRIYSEKVHYYDMKHAAKVFCDLLEPLGIKYTPEKLVSLNVSDADKTRVAAKLMGLTKKPLNETKLIGMHVSTAESAEYRAWPKANFAELSDMLLAKYDNAFVLLTGTEAENKANNAVIKLCKNQDRIINLAGLLGFPEFISLFSYLDLYISNDTGPMHLSAAQGAKTIGLFGPNLPLRFGPYPVDNKTNFAIYHGDKLPCSPCINVHLGKFRKCSCIKAGTAECMTLITPEEVCNLAESIL